MALKKENRLSAKDFLKNKGKNFFWSKGDFLTIKSLKKNQKESRFGFVVGLNVSKKAAERNLIKRRLRYAVQKELPNIKQGFDIIVIVSPLILGKDYKETKKDFLAALKKLKLLKND